MLAIRCYGEYSFGGRTQDEYIINEFNNLEDFKKSINKNEFINCKEIKQRHKRYIIVEEELVERVVNFSNYMKISEMDIDLISKDELNELVNNLCEHCTRHDGAISQMLSCGYHPIMGKHCKNFEEIFKSKFRRRFKGKSVNEY